MAVRDIYGRPWQCAEPGRIFRSAGSPPCGRATGAPEPTASDAASQEKVGAPPGCNHEVHTLS